MNIDTQPCFFTGLNSADPMAALACLTYSGHRRKLTVEILDYCDISNELLRLLDSDDVNWLA